MLIDRKVLTVERVEVVSDLCMMGETLDLLLMVVLLLVIMVLLLAIGVLLFDMIMVRKVGKTCLVRIAAVHSETRQLQTDSQRKAAACRAA